MDNAGAHLKVKVNPKVIAIEWNWNTLYRECAEGRFSCFIPGFNLRFSTSTIEDIQKKGEMMTTAFLNYFMDDLPKNNLRELVLELNRLGFKIDTGNVGMREILSQNVKRSHNFVMPQNPFDTNLYPNQIVSQTNKAFQLAS